MTPPNYDRRIATALEGIEKHNRDLVKVMEALNKNFVVFAKVIQDAMEPFEEEERCKHAQGDCCRDNGCRVCHPVEPNPKCVSPSREGDNDFQVGDILNILNENLTAEYGNTCEFIDFMSAHIHSMEYKEPAVLVGTNDGRETVFPLDSVSFHSRKGDKCSGCGNEYCEVLGCNPKISALKCGCSPNYCCCGPNDVKTEESDGT